MQFYQESIRVPLNITDAASGKNGMTFLNNSTLHNSPDNTVEFYVRTALAFGELPSAAEAEINRLVTQGNLSIRDCTLLSVLRDAIQDGCIRRVRLSKRKISEP